MNFTQIISIGSVSHSSQLKTAATITALPFQHFNNVAEAFQSLQANNAGILAVEHPYLDVEPSEFLETVAKEFPDMMVVFNLPESQASVAVRLVRLGAYSCIDPNMEVDQIAEVLDQAAEEIRARRASRRIEQEPWRNLLIGQSLVMKDLARVIHLVAKRRCTVLITGETGTGKEVAARAIHMASDRSQMPMVAVNCSAIPEHLLEAELFGHTKGAFTGAVNARVGRFEEANNGTLFLDEIGDMPIELQAKLLRVLQEREIQRLGSGETIKVNVRVIAATNLNLHERVKEGKFREDLYYRLNVVPLQMPALCERADDVPTLARHFVSKICRLEGLPEKQLYNETIDHLSRYHWPGNVRQLENMIEKGVVMSGERDYLLPSDFQLPAMAPSLALRNTMIPTLPVPDHGLDFARTITIFEKSLLDQALERAHGNKTIAADLLRLKRTTLLSKLRVLESVTA